MFARIPHVGPRSSSRSEPTTGPASTPRDLNVAFSRTALGSSAGSAKSCSISCSAGPHSAPAQPCSTSSTQALHISSVPVRNSRPQLRDTTANRPWAIWMMRRQSYFSANPPNSTENSRNGSQWLITWKPTSHGDWNTSHSTQ